VDHAEVAWAGLARAGEEGARIAAALYGEDDRAEPNAGDAAGGAL